MPSTPLHGRRHTKYSHKRLGGKPYGIHRSLKKHALRTKVEEAQRKMLEQYRTPKVVYVGNLRPHITVQHVKEYFNECGAMLDAEVAIAHGSQPNVRNPFSGYDNPDAAFPDLRNATIRFLETRGVQKALELNGTFFMGCHIIVSLSTLDLPETQNFIRHRLDRIAGTSRVKAHGRKLQLEPTLVVTPYNGRAAN